MRARLEIVAKELEELCQVLRQRANVIDSKSLEEG